MGSCGWWLRIWFGSCRISLVGCQPGVQKTDSYRLDYHTVRAASSSSTTHAHLQVLSISCTSIRQAQPSQMPTWLGLASFTWPVNFSKFEKDLEYLLHYHLGWEMIDSPSSISQVLCLLSEWDLEPVSCSLQFIITCLYSWLLFQFYGLFQRHIILFLDLAKKSVG
jgi:hypothetical protein